MLGKHVVAVCDVVHKDGLVVHHLESLDVLLMEPLQRTARVARLMHLYISEASDAVVKEAWCRVGDENPGEETKDEEAGEHPEDRNKSPQECHWGYINNTFWEQELIQTPENQV